MTELVKKKEHYSTLIERCCKQPKANFIISVDAIDNPEEYYKEMYNFVKNYHTASSNEVTNNDWIRFK